ncbi:hypothetical protein [Salinispora vitiensis]|uniref:hypothetical protein n=1 Tax=Salinispora vitiensis TaxID=999544 RepID=UPI0004BCA863|nr:hypothetical protein [Salinispora vitiensis]
MAEMDPRELRWWGRLLLLGFPWFAFVVEFVLLFLTYLVLAPIAPSMLGEVAASPARFAAWVALVKVPMTLAHMLAVSWRSWVLLVTKGEILDHPARKGWRRGLVIVRDSGVSAMGFVLAALIVFGHVADPGDAWVWQLVVVTAAGPLLLSAIGKGISWLLRWWWRRRHSYQARHLRSDEDAISS